LLAGNVLQRWPCVFFQNDSIVSGHEL
jgi:hypothetical protein